MVSATIVLFAALAAVVSAAPGCRPPLTYILPKVGGNDELAAPAAGLVLKKIAIGHGIQNYSCESTTAEAKATGAVAILYDATSLYPGTKKTGVKQKAWDSIPADVVGGTPLPLNKLAGTEFGADPLNAFPEASDLKLRGAPKAKFLGHHYFDSDGIPVFVIPSADLTAAVEKIKGVPAPSDADKGVIGTGAVAWLQLDDNGTGNSKGVTSVFRVITAGGAPRACSVAGVGIQSVPYATYYWFFG